MLSGFLRIAFTGAAGSGLGMLVLHNGVIVGADVGGATYDGTYTEETATRETHFEITMGGAPGMTPVQTGVPIPSPISVPITGTLNQDDVDKQHPILVQTPLGPVNVVFAKLRDIA